jgi:phosphoglycolate phosphatase-like HAD superfamily hydrolase
MEEIRNKASEIAEKYELKRQKPQALLPGVHGNPKGFEKMDLKMGLCTINSEKSTNYILKRFGIAAFSTR